MIKKKKKQNNLIDKVAITTSTPRVAQVHVYNPVFRINLPKVVLSLKDWLTTIWDTSGLVPSAKAWLSMAPSLPYRRNSKDTRYALQGGITQLPCGCLQPSLA